MSTEHAAFNTLTRNSRGLFWAKMTKTLHISEIVEILNPVAAVDGLVASRDVLIRGRGALEIRFGASNPFEAPGRITETRYAVNAEAVQHIEVKVVERLGL